MRKQHNYAIMTYSAAGNQIQIVKFCCLHTFVL